MPVRNLGFYNLNETRPYPVADSSDLRSVAGARLPHDLIIDLNLRYPEALGRYVYLATVGVTDHLVSLTIQAATSLDDVTTLSPVAALGLPRPILEGRPYALEPQYPGVGGWVVFGSGVQQNFSGRFLGPRRTLLDPRAARAYQPLPVTSLSKLHAMTPLTGLVRLIGVEPVEIVKEDREIDGINRDVIVIRLVQPGTDASVAGLLADESNVFQQMLGKCSARPESRTCGDPVPLEFLNYVPPDCDGNITIQLQGCAQVAEIVQGGGVVIDCELGLIDACLPGTLADATGKLRTEYDDECDAEPSEPSAPSEPSESPDPEPSESPLPSDSVSDSEVVIGELPYLECFDGGTADNWSVKNGEFSLTEDDSPEEECQSIVSAVGHRCYTASSQASQNLSVWEGFDDSSLNRRITVDMKLMSGEPGGQRNGAVVFNYRPHNSQPGRVQYFLADVNFDLKRFRVMRWNGNSFTAESAFVELPGLLMNTWYRVIVDTEPGTGSAVNITVSLEALTGPALSVTLGPFSTNQYLPDTGLMGVYADRAVTRFSFVKLEAI